MGIMLGNIKVSELEKRLEIELTKEDKEWMEKKRTNLADGEEGKYHCFDLPFMIVAHDMNLAKEIHSILGKYEIKGRLEIGYK